MILVSLFLIHSISIAQQSDFTGNINFFLGEKNLDNKDWGPVEEQKEYGINIDIKHKYWPISIVFVFLTSEDESIEYHPTVGNFKFKGELSELQIGIKKIKDYSPTHIYPFISGGLTHIKAKGTFSQSGEPSDSYSDSGLGFWIGGGVYRTFNNIINIGIELKYSKAEVTPIKSVLEAGGFHYGGFVGFHW